MSDTATAVPIDARKLVKSLDYGELFEGTALEGVEDEEGSIAEAIGRRLGEMLGRVVGEALGRRLGAVVVPMLVDGSLSSDDGDEGSADESAGESGASSAGSSNDADDTDDTEEDDG